MLILLFFGTMTEFSGESLDERVSSTLSGRKTGANAFIENENFRYKFRAECLSIYLDEEFLIRFGSR